MGSREDIVPGIRGFCSASVVNLAISVLGTLFGPEMVVEGIDNVGEAKVKAEDAVEVIAGWLETRELAETN